MLRAAEKEKILEWAINKIKDADDVESVNRIEKWAYPRIKGSNERKNALWDAAEIARKRLGETQ